MHTVIISDRAFEWWSSRIDLVNKNMRRFPQNYEEDFVMMMMDMNAALESSQHKADPKPPKEAKSKAPRAASVPIRDGCSEHTTYGAKRRPRTDCDACWALYEKLNPMNYTKARREFERKQES